MNLRNIKTGILSIRLPSIVTVILSLLSPEIARADQCVWVSKQQALAAMARLEPGQTIYSLCEPCGEKKPQSIVIKTIALNNIPESRPPAWKIKINDREIDFAYTYLMRRDKNQQSKANFLVNLSMIANCPANDISPTIPIK